MNDGGCCMKIKFGPVEFEQDALKDEILLEEYKKSPKEVEKYLKEKSKFYDETLKNIIAGKTMKTVRDFIFSIVGVVFFTGWSLYVFFVSKDAIVWDEVNAGNAFSVILQAFFIILICFMPVILIVGLIKTVNIIASRKK